MADELNSSLAVGIGEVGNINVTGHTIKDNQFLWKYLGYAYENGDSSKTKIATTAIARMKPFIPAFEAQ